MIIQGNELQVFDLVASYAQRYQKTLLHFNLDKYNSLDATKKATVTTYYTPIVDDYVLDIINRVEYLILFHLMKKQQQTLTQVHGFH